MHQVIFLLFSLLLLFSCGEATTSTTEKKTTSSTIIKENQLLKFDLANQYPEGIEYNPSNNSIYLGSMSGEPIVYINEDGTITQFSQEKPAPLGSIGIEIDEANGRLIACYSDRNNTIEEPIAIVRVFDLETGKLLQDLNLASLIDAQEYQANDATVTADATIIISDRKGNALYKIDKDYNTSVFYRNEEELHMPNGLVYHPDDFILVAHSKDGPKLCKFPFATPEQKQEVLIEDKRFEGFDGIVLVDKNTLVGVTTVKGEEKKDALLELTTTDNWTTATVSNYRKVNPSTTVAIAASKKYYVLNQDFRNPTAKTVTIEQVQFEEE